MDLHEAVEFIRPGVKPTVGYWADIGAGSGVFTEALMEILIQGKIYAVDKSPHALYNLKPHPGIELQIVEADFHQSLDLPKMDGLVVANALHYAKDHVMVLKNILDLLNPGGNLILVEYDTDIPRIPWVPNPVSFVRFKELCVRLNLKEPNLIGRKQSIYGEGDLYAAFSRFN